MAVIALEGMRFRAPHGVYAEEKSAGNDFVVDVYLTASIGRSAETDRLEHTADYALAYEIVKRALLGPSVNLLEKLVVQIGREVLATVPGVQKVKVRLRKLNPPLGGPVAETFVEEEFSI